MELIIEAVASGCRLRVACSEWNIDKRTYSRWQNDPYGDKRKGPMTKPANKLSQEERQKVIKIATSKEFCDLPPSQIVPRLADRGEYVASESTFYRILKEEKMLEHRGKQKQPVKNKPEELVARQPNQVWSWDITFLKSSIQGMYFYLYLVMDIYSRKIVGFELSHIQSQELASQMIQRVCMEEKVDKNQLYLHADNGGPMKGATMLATLQKLGVIPSFSRPNVSDDNPFSESLFKTLKYRPNYPAKPFETIEEATAWIETFIYWYNNEHLHSSIKFVAPNSRHEGIDSKILENRKEVYQMAKQQNPNRWSREIRNWDKPEIVRLNPLIGKEKFITKNAA